MKLLLDTNVIIDYLGKRIPFFQHAQQVIAAGYFGDAQLWASVQSFKDAFYVLSRFGDAHQVQDSLSRLMEIVHPVDMTGNDIASALRMGWEDMEDCLIALSAQKVGAEYLITRDSSGFSRSMVPPLDPASWLARIQEEKSLTFSALSL